MEPAVDARTTPASLTDDILNPLPSPPLFLSIGSAHSSMPTDTPGLPEAAFDLPHVHAVDTPNTASARADVSGLAPVSASPVTAGSIEHDMNVIVGGTLVPAHTTPSTNTPINASPNAWPTRTGPGLRLPSFETLGIATYRPAPIDFSTVIPPISDIHYHPRSITHRDQPVSPPCEFSHAESDSAIGSAAAAAAAKLLISSCRGRAVPVPVRQVIAALTPPVEKGQEADSIMAVTGAALESPFSDPGQAILSDVNLTEDPATASGASESLELQQGEVHLEAAVPWAHTALRLLLETVKLAPAPNNPLRVLSHALPIPSQSGHAFPGIIGAVHASIPARPTLWINVFHAIPGRFNLADIPTSPPSTPGPSVGGEDYFTQKIFDTAVPITDYQGDLSSLPRSPHPVVPPSSINVSIVERYIPPTNTNEFSSMFSLTGPSILVDRLVELSPQNGNLIFVYPTRTGAQTFMREYLGPIIDPLLRSTVVVHGLSSELGNLLGNMTAVNYLREHDELEASLNELCVRLTRKSATMNVFQGTHAAFELIHSAKVEVQPSREVWSRDWWVKQEKPKIRDAVTRISQEAQKKSSNLHVERVPSSTELVQHLIDGVTHKQAYPVGWRPTKGIEVGVFVVKRTA